MRKIFFSLSLVGCLAAATATQAQVVVWSQNFDAEPLGAYGTTEPFGTTPTLNIVSPGAGGTNQAMEISFTPTSGQNVNFQVQTLQYPTSGNTNTVVGNYTLEFDMQISPFTPGYNMEISVEGSDGSTFGGHVSRFTVGSPPLPAGGAGYVHISLPLSNSVAGNNGEALNPTDTSFRIAFGALAFPSSIGDGVTPELIDVDNIVILMTTNPPVIPPPTMGIVKTTPALRIFEQNAGSVFSQEGIGTVDANQSWLGSTAANPTTYKISIASFPPTANTALHMQFVPGSAVNPFVVFASANAMDWTIQRGASGFFSQSVAWKTNSANNVNGGTTNISVNAATNTSTTGVGTWTLTFTNDTDGTLTAPDGSTNSFSLPPDMAALFANPVVLCIGTTPGSPAGFGEFFDLNRITITNTVQVDDDDFTKDDVFNTALWTSAFSLDDAKAGNAGSVFQVSTNTPLWVTWTGLDDNFQLATTGNLTNQWFTPNYYGSATGVSITIPTKMGATKKWTLIPSGALPTIDGIAGDPVSPIGFFRLQNPAPIQ